jgi:hypothetical protein
MVHVKIGDTVEIGWLVEARARKSVLNFDSLKDLSLDDDPGVMSEVMPSDLLHCDVLLSRSFGVPNTIMQVSMLIPLFSQLAIQVYRPLHVPIGGL